MRSVRKETGGYALAYVLIVILVLCAIAMAICTIALRNYQGQVRAVAQTQQLYQAEGEIEIFVALAEDTGELNAALAGKSEEELAALTVEQVYADYVNDVKALGADPNDGLTVEYDGIGDAFTVTCRSGSVQVEAVIVFRLSGTAEKGFTASHTYQSYTINRSAAEGGEGNQTE